MDLPLVLTLAHLGAEPSGKLLVGYPPRLELSTSLIYRSLTESQDRELRNHCRVPVSQRRHRNTTGCHAIIASDCGWPAHARYVLAKATKTVHALGAVLHNKRVSTVVRRVVLQAVLRPVVEFGSRLGAGCYGPGLVGAGANCSPTPNGLV
jgi:hypothetical protein